MYSWHTYENAIISLHLHLAGQWVQQATIWSREANLKGKITSRIVIELNSASMSAPPLRHWLQSNILIKTGRLITKVRSGHPGTWPLLPRRALLNYKFIYLPPPSNKSSNELQLFVMVGIYIMSSDSNRSPFPGKGFHSSRKVEKNIPFNHQLRANAQTILSIVLW